MKIEKATIEISNGAAETTLEYLNMEVIDLAHELIRLAQPKIDTTVPDSQVEKFKLEAKRDYMGSTKLFTDFEAYQELYTRMKIGEYIRLEHAKQAYNEMIIAYSKNIDELKTQFKNGH